VSRAPAGIRSAVSVVVVVAALVVGAFVAFAGYRYADTLIAKGQRRVENLTPVTPGEPTNILIVGSDSRAGLSKQELSRLQTQAAPGQRTDTIIVMHVSPGHRKVVMISIPRDLKVRIDGRETKINSEYGGRPERMVAAVEQVTGLKINHYVELDFAGFIGVVNKVGGVRLCNNTGRQLDDQDANLHMPPGCHTMRGDQALAYVRARHISDTFGRDDFGRMRRQQEFLRALMAKVERNGNLVNLPRLIGIANVVSDHVRTDQDLGVQEALSLARRIGKLTPGDVDMRVYPSVPEPPACPTCPDYVVSLPDAYVLLRAVGRDAKVLPPIGLPGRHGVSLRDVRVDVLNATGRQGAARRVAGGLERLGVHVGAIGNASSGAATASTLAYAPGQAEQAKLLASLFASPVKVVPGGHGRTMVLTVGPGLRLDVPAAAEP
jgi:LCP family protein required for cell wall assembly